MVSMGNKGSDEGEIDQGCDEAGETPKDAAVGVYGDVASLVAVVRQQEAVGLGKRAAIGGVDGNSDAVEFFDDATNGKGRQIPHTGSSYKSRIPW